MTDLSDPKYVEERKASAKQRQRTNDDAFAALLSSPSGRQWLFDFLSTCHVFTTTHRGEAPLTSAFCEGERNIGLRLIADTMRISPASFTKMLEENSNGR